MKVKLCLALAVIMLAVFTASCGGDDKRKIDVEKYRENLRKSGQQNSISPEEREKALKQMFPNYKPKRD